MRKKAPIDMTDDEFMAHFAKMDRKQELPMKPKPIDWFKYLPASTLPNSGRKTFIPGQVWTSKTTDDSQGRVFKILKATDANPEYFEVESLAGRGVEVVSEASGVAHRAVLVRDVDEDQPRNPADVFAFDACFVEKSPTLISWYPPRYQEVIARIMAKAEKHRLAGRTGFQQCFVPLDDYRALREYFAGFTPVVMTCLGPISISPVNVDGATFSE